MAKDQRKTVLIIDEEVSSLRATREVLERAGYRVASRPTVAAATADLGWCHPDIVVLDDRPVGSNLRVIVPLLRGPDQSRLVLLYSSTALSELIPLAASVGADGYADKKAGVFRLLQEMRRVGADSPKSTSMMTAEARAQSEPPGDRRIQLDSGLVDALSARSGTHSAVAPASSRRMPRLLIIDDELSILSAFRRLLQREGFICDYVLSGREALRRIRSKEPPDVVVSDVIMRSPNGSDVFREIFSEDPGWERRYVFVTGDPMTARRLIRHTSENVTILAKPVGADQMIAAIRSRLAIAS